VTWADVVILKDGSRIEGTVIERTERVIRIRTAAGRVRNVRLADVKKVETDSETLPPKSEKDDSADDPRHVDTKRFEEKLERKLNVVSKPHVLIRGDHDHDELQTAADSAEMTVLHFEETFECDASKILPGRSGYAGLIEVWQFRQEKGYLQFMDRIFDEQRDRKVIDDERFKMMRQNRGFWNTTPEGRIGGYQGPSPIEGVVANVSHKTSHVLLDLWKNKHWKRPWWLYEGLATWQEMQITGVSRTYCLEPATPGDYSREGTGEADELAKAQTAKLWLEHIRKKVKARDERDLKVLGRLGLNELNRDEVIQAWSVVDWLASRRKLKAFVEALKDDQDLDAALKSTLELDTAAAHEKWREWVLADR
jgi:hypothetical protein